MPTRLDLRVILRRRLSDTGTSPLWEEDFLNDAITEAIRRYSTPVPRQAVAAIPVLEGDRELEMPESVNAMRVVHVFDDQGTPWRRWEGTGAPPSAPYGYADPAAIWRAWGTEIILGVPAPRDGLWRIEHEANRADPLDDVTDLDISPGDSDIVLALAFSVALHRRAVAEGKRYNGRSGVHPLAAAARTAQADADRLLWHRFRHVRSGTLTNTMSRT
jgi:hypothetical protein